jgi:hypothetical protein
MASRVRAGIIYLTFASLLIIGFTSFRRLGAITIHHKAGKINEKMRAVEDFIHR